MRFSRGVLVILFLVGGFAGRAHADDGSGKGAVGVGIILGEPTGVCAKIYLGTKSDFAIDMAAGGAVVGGGLQAHGDALWHPWILSDEDTFVLPAYIGAGIRLLDHTRGRSDSDFHGGIRAVVGMLFDFKNLPIDVFVEVAGVLDYVVGSNGDHDGIGFGFNGGAGVRYYF